MNRKTDLIIFHESITVTNEKSTKKNTCIFHVHFLLHQQNKILMPFTCLNQNHFAFSNPSQIGQKANYNTIVIPFYSHMLALSKNQHEHPNFVRVPEVRETSMPSFESENAQEAK